MTKCLPIRNSNLEMDWSLQIVFIYKFLLTISLNLKEIRSVLKYVNLNPSP